MAPSLARSRASKFACSPSSRLSDAPPASDAGARAPAPRPTPAHNSSSSSNSNNNSQAGRLAALVQAAQQQQRELDDDHSGAAHYDQLNLSLKQCMPHLSPRPLRTPQQVSDYLEGVSAASSVAPLSLEDFSPTNFYVQWPSALSSPPRPSCKWLSPRDMILHSLPVKSVDDFPSQLATHTLPAHTLNTFAPKAPAPVPASTTANNTKVSPAAYAPVLATSLSTRGSVQPPPPRSLQPIALMSSPGVGSYNPHVNQHVQVHYFGGTQKTQVLNSLSHLTPDAPGPGSYDVAAPPIPTLPLSRTARFKPAVASRVGPGQYTVRVSSGPACTFSSPSSHAQFTRRSHGPDMGTYNNTPIRLGAAIRFGSQPRFNYQTRPHPLYALVISDAKKRQSELRSAIQQQDFSQYARDKKTERILQQQALREQRQLEASRTRVQLHESHLDQIDRVLNRDVYRARERARLANEELDQRVMMGWLFYTALASRMHVIAQRIRRVRMEKNLRILTNRAANTIINYSRKWLSKAHAKRVHRSALIICRALRRNVVRASLRRKRRAALTITVLLVNIYNKSKIIYEIKRYRRFAIVIQRAWRLFALKRELTLELMNQHWQKYEELLASKYRNMEGEKAFEKIRKKGLLLKNVSLSDQKHKIIAAVPWENVPDALRADILCKDYRERLAVHRTAMRTWRAARAQQHTHTDNPSASTTSTVIHVTSNAPPSSQQHEGTHSSSPSPSPSNQGDSESTPLQRPYFQHLIPPTRLYTLMSQAQLKLTPPPDLEVRKKYKRLIQAILKAVATRTKKLLQQYLGVSSVAGDALPSDVEGDDERPSSASPRVPSKPSTAHAQQRSRAPSRATQLSRK